MRSCLAKPNSTLKTLVPPLRKKSLRSKSFLRTTAKADISREGKDNMQGLCRRRGPFCIDKIRSVHYNGGMLEQFSRTALVLGGEAVEKLQVSRVAVFGLGGVGSWCAEALARAGVGHLTLIDRDRVEESNINRQLAALHSTIGRAKTDVMRERIADINPACAVMAQELFYLPETAHLLPLDGYDFVADCIDTVTAKLHLICTAFSAHVPVISATGAGNKRRADAFRVSDLSRTHTDPLARVLRRELKKRGIEHLPVVWSDEPPAGGSADAVGSLPFVPPVMGFLMAGYIIGELVK